MKNKETLGEKNHSPEELGSTPNIDPKSLVAHRKSTVARGGGGTPPMPCKETLGEKIDDHKWSIICYSSWSGKKIDQHILTAKNNKGVVGAVKLMVDNFSPVHIDIIKEGSQNEKRNIG